MPRAISRTAVSRTKSASRLRLAIVPVAVIAGAIAAWKLGYFELDGRREMLARVQRLRMVDGIALWYVSAYCLVVLLCLPATVFTVLGGAIFGPWIGAILAWIGALAGTVVTHWLARSVARRPMTRLFGEHRLLRYLREHDSVVALLRLRVLPIAPFGVLNYLAGIGGVSLRRLLLATAVGTLNTLPFAFVGHALFKGLLSEDEGSRTALWIAGGVTLVMLALSVAPHLLHGRRKQSRPA